MLEEAYDTEEMCSYLSFGEKKNNTKVKRHQVVLSILYRLKTGCQWRNLPMKEFFDKKYSWKSVYYHFQRWSKDGIWEKMNQGILKKKEQT